MVFRRCRGNINDGNTISIKIDNRDLIKVNHVRFLGVTLDESITWNYHISYVTARISRFIPIIYAIRHNLNASSLKLLYHGIIYPSLTYCSSVWGNGNRTHIKSLEVALKKIIRAIMFKSQYEHTTPLFNRLKLLNFNNIVKYMSLLFVFKSIQSEGPLFTRYPENNYNTRATTMSLLQMPNIFSTHSRRGVRWTGAGLWNWLPAVCRPQKDYELLHIQNQSKETSFSNPGRQFAKFLGPGFSASPRASGFAPIE